MSFLVCFGHLQNFATLKAPYLRTAALFRLPGAFGTTAGGRTTEAGLIFSLPVEVTPPDGRPGNHAGRETSAE